MKSRRCAVFGFATLAIVVFCRPATVTANICVDKRLDPLKHFCGRVVDSSGTPIPNVTLSLLKGGIEVATKNTDARGEFSFDQLKIGEYEFRASAMGFGKIGLPFVIFKPNAKCRQKVEIQLAFGGECGHVRLLKQ